MAELKKPAKIEYDFTHYTYAPDWVLDRSVITEKHLKFYAANCRKLANYMEKLPDQLHVQGTWAHSDTTEPNVCGTPACALGHAAYSNEFPGLQFGINGTACSGYQQIIDPVINGGRTDWETAGMYFFGQDAQDQIFNAGHWTKNEVVNRLRRLADRLDAAWPKFLKERARAEEQGLKSELAQLKKQYEEDVKDAREMFEEEYTFDEYRHV